MSDSASGKGIAATAGVFTAIAGSALLIAPHRLGPVIGLTAKRDVVLVGCLDLVLSPGLILGQPRWPWLAARAVSNAATSLFVLQRAADATSRRNARVFSAALAVATVTDVRAARALLRVGED